MRISKEARKLSRQLFKNSLTDGRLNDARVRSIVRGIADKKPRNYLGVLKNYLRLVRLEAKQNHALIESAVELDLVERANVESDVRKRFGEHLTTEFRIEPALIGGLRIQVGSDVWDGSVQGRLERLQSKL